MSVPVYVSTMGNLALQLVPPFTWHSFEGPIPLPIAPTIDFPVPIMWAPGFALLQNKLTTTVLHKFQFMMLEGHDCGYMIPHLSIPPTNAKLPIIIAFSSRKANFSASTVKANGLAVGCAQLAAAHLPMTSCWNPISIPGAYPINFLNTLKVGITPKDFAAGMVSIVLSLVQDTILAPKGIESSSLLGDVVGGLLGGGSFREIAVKAFFGAASGAAKILLTGEGTVSVAVGSAYGQITFTYSRDLDGAISKGGSIQLGTSSAEYKSTENADGSSASELSLTQGTPVIQTNYKKKSEYDSSGRETRVTETRTVTGGTAPPFVLPGTTAGTYEKTTVSEPGKSPKTTESGFLAGGGPINEGMRTWGPKL